MKALLTLRASIIALAALCCVTAHADAPRSEESRPNVLVIVVDDLNDWLGCLGGHPNVKTPNIDRLAARGTLFANAHCAAPLCNPSRAAIFSGRQPLETGVFANDESNIRRMWPDLPLIPQWFARAGYRTFGAGKLLHQTSRDLFDEEFFPECRWSPFAPKQVNYTSEELPSKKTANPRHVATLAGQEVVLPLNRMPSERDPDSAGGDSFDWGPLPVDDLDMGDGQLAAWGAERLAKAHERPFFMAIGFYRPHIPLFAPRKYFDLYAGETIALPTVLDGDLDDLSQTARLRALAADTAGTHDIVVRHDQWTAAVTAYLACISFVDAQVGRLLDALDASPSADNTVIVFFGDHGWHLGEKQHWGKWTGWRRSTRVPLIVAPARSEDDQAFRTGSICEAPVSLLDVYPTLVELCGLPPREALSGQSLVPFLRDPRQPSDRVVLTTFDKGNYSLTAPRWHFLRYADGSEELYDLESDPNEWRNLASDAAHATIKAEMARRLPDESAYPAPPAGGSGVKKKASP